MNKTIQEMIELYKKWVKALESSIEEAGTELEKATLMARKETYTMEMIPALERLLVNAIAETEEPKKMENKYKVTIVQNLKYTETFRAYFDNLAAAGQFIDTVMEHSAGIESIQIDVVFGGEEE